MAFCSQCGNKLEEGARFCPSCGKPVESNAAGKSQRIQVFEGNIHKCPNCGEIIKSFTSICPSCGYEFRDAKASSAVKEFASRLQAIEDSRPPKSKISGLANAFGVSQTSKTDEQKINLIQSFSVPNTKEDITEFMILASSNIDPSLFCIYNNQMTPGERQNQLKVTKAWIAKYEQAYQKAKLSFGNDPDFERIQSIYDKKEREIKSGKRKTPMIIGGLVIVYIIIMAFCFGMIGGTTKREKELKKTVQEIQVDIQNGDYDDALIKANTLYYDRGSSRTKADDWDKQREALIELIQEKKKEAGQ